MGVPRNEEPPETKNELDQYKNIEEFQMPRNGCRRMIILDGANVIHCAGKSGRKIMDIKVWSDKLTAISILSIVQKCMAHGFEVLVVMKKFFDEHKNSDNYEFLEELRELELVRFAEDQIDDDELVLNSAQFYGAAVITRDKYRQAFYNRYTEGKSRSFPFYFSKSKLPRSEFHKEENIVDMFTDLKFLNFNLAYAKPTDPDFSKVKTIYEQYRNSGYFEMAYPRVKMMCEFLQFEMCQFSRIKVPTLQYFNTQKQCPAKYREFRDECLKNKKRAGNSNFHR